MVFALIISVFLNVLFLIGLGFAVFYLIRFARIIFSIEDLFEKALDTLSGVDEALDGLLNMKLFFDSKEVKLAVDQALNGTKLSRMAVQQLINDFTRLSKEKYLMVKNDEEEEKEFEEGGS